MTPTKITPQKVIKIEGVLAVVVLASAQSSLGDPRMVHMALATLALFDAEDDESVTKISVDSGTREKPYKVAAARSNGPGVRVAVVIKKSHPVGKSLQRLIRGLLRSAPRASVAAPVTLAPRGATLVIAESQR